jgi:hypothetical protein
VSYLARYSGQTHTLYACQLRRWFAWCEASALEPLVGIQRAHVELYIPHLGECGLMPSSVNTMMHAVRGFFRFAHIDGLIGGTPPLPTPSTRASHSVMLRSSLVTPTHAPPSTTTGPEETSTDTAFTFSPPTSPASEQRLPRASRPLVIPRPRRPE